MSAANPVSTDSPDQEVLPTPNSRVSGVQGTLPGRTHVTGPGGLSPEGFAAWYRDRALEQWRALDLVAVGRIAEAVVEAQERGRQVFVMGNGGSAATASHLATDLSKTAAVEGRPRVRCLSLSDNIALISAIGNDHSFDDMFVMQLEPLLNPRDLVILVSGSGNSRNLVKAAEYAKARGALTVGLLGFDGGRLSSIVDIPLVVASDQYGVIEDMHMGIGHVLAFYLKQRR